MKDNLFVGKEARAKILAGVDKVANAVKLTLGAKGSNALLERMEYPGYVITNDGISIVESIVLEDPIENIGANLVKETSGRHNKQSGDGSTTTVVLLQAILNEAQKVDASPIEIMNSLNECLPIILKSIDDQTKQITVDEVGRVASISAEDEKIGALIQEIYQQIGKDGILYPDISKTYEDSYTIGKGVKIDMAGFLSPYMADLDTSGRFLSVVSFKNPKILITKQKLSSASELNDIAAYLFSKEIKELVVFADEVEGAVIPDLIRTRAEKGFRIVVVKMPTIWKDMWYEDLAQMTGATVVSPVAGISYKTLKPEHLGTCENILIDKTDTYLDGIQDLTNYIQTLQQNTDDESKIRIARLNTKTARLFVGAYSDAMLSYRRLKIDDSRNSSYLALQHGIVPGGGVALYSSIQDLPFDAGEDENGLKVPHHGADILREALKAPIRQIITNAGFVNDTDESLGNRIAFHSSRYSNDEDGKYQFILNPKGLGFDAKTCKLTDLMNTGIVDSASVVKSAITQAISVAGTLLTANIITTLPHEDTSKMPAL